MQNPVSALKASGREKPDQTLTTQGVRDPGLTQWGNLGSLHPSCSLSLEKAGQGSDLTISVFLCPSADFPPKHLL